MQLIVSQVSKTYFALQANSLVLQKHFHVLQYVGMEFASLEKIQAVPKIAVLFAAMEFVRQGKIQVLVPKIVHNQRQPVVT